MMYCAECGAEMTQNENGSWKICCNGVGYWYEAKPLPRDNWWPTLTKGGLTFYPTVYWPMGQKPSHPSEEKC